MVTAIVLVLLVLWLVGYLGPATSPYRTWGGGFGYHGLGPILVVLAILALLRII